MAMIVPPPVMDRGLQMALMGFAQPFGQGLAIAGQNRLLQEDLAKLQAFRQGIPAVAGTVAAGLEQGPLAGLNITPQQIPQMRSGLGQQMMLSGLGQQMLGDPFGLQQAQAEYYRARAQVAPTKATAPPSKIVGNKLYERNPVSGNWEFTGIEATPDPSMRDTQVVEREDPNNPGQMIKEIYDIQTGELIKKIGVSGRESISTTERRARAIDAEIKAIERLPKPLSERASKRLAELKRLAGLAEALPTPSQKMAQHRLEYAERFMPGSDEWKRALGMSVKEQYPAEYQADLKNAVSALARGADAVKVYHRIASKYPKLSAELKRILLYTPASKRLELLREALFGG